MPLIVTVELIPRGDESRKRKVAVVDICNDGTGTHEVGNYDVRAEGDTVGGYDTFYHGKVRGVKRGDYLNQVIECLRGLHTANKESAMTTPTTPAPVDGTLDPVLAFCERSFSAIVELTCIVKAMLPNGPDGTAAKRRLTDRFEALAEPIGKIRQANKGILGQG